MFKFDAFQTYGKDALEASVASTTAMTKGYQTVAQEMIDFNRRSFEKSAAAVEQAAQLKSFDQVLTAQQTFAKEAYETFASESSRIGNIYLNAMKDAYRPFEGNLQAFGVNLPK
jgi:hypothetical protein